MQLAGIWGDDRTMLSLSSLITEQLLDLLNGRKSKTDVVTWADRKVDESVQYIGDEKTWRYLEFVRTIDEQTKESTIINAICTFDGASKLLPSINQLTKKLSDIIGGISREEIASWATKFIPYAEPLYENDQIDDEYWELLQFVAGIDDPDNIGDYLFSDEQIDEVINKSKKVWN